MRSGRTSKLGWTSGGYHLTVTHGLYQRTFSFWGKPINYPEDRLTAGANLRPMGEINRDTPLLFDRTGGDAGYKAHRSGTHRTVSPAETVARVRPLMTPLYSGGTEGGSSGAEEPPAPHPSLDACARACLRFADHTTTARLADHVAATHSPLRVSMAPRFRLLDLSTFA